MVDKRSIIRGMRDIQEGQENGKRWHSGRIE